MKRKRFTEEQIIAVLREHETGAKTADVARKHGISEATLYNRKAKYGGMVVSDAKRLGKYAWDRRDRRAHRLRFRGSDQSGVSSSRRFADRSMAADQEHSGACRRDDSELDES
jgi:hypothetical protein